MQKYKINISLAARKDILEVVEYIAVTLANPSAAERLYEKINKALENAAAFPDAAPSIDFSYSSKLRYRKIVVDNYILFYVADHAAQSIDVVRFLYGARDWLNLI